MINSGSSTSRQGHIPIINDTTGSITLSDISPLSERVNQAQCEVVLNGESTGILVPGHILEAAVQFNDQRYVQLLAHNVLFKASPRLCSSIFARV